MKHYQPSTTNKTCYPPLAYLFTINYHELAIINHQLTIINHPTAINSPTLNDQFTTYSPSSTIIKHHYHLPSSTTIKH